MRYGRINPMKQQNVKSAIYVDPLIEREKNIEQTAEMVAGEGDERNKMYIKRNKIDTTARMVNKRLSDRRVAEMRANWTKRCQCFIDFAKKCEVGVETASRTIWHRRHCIMKSKQHEHMPSVADD